MRRSNLDQNANDDNIDQFKRNDDFSEELSSKVSALKSLSIEIGSEIKYQNSFLSDMHQNFEGSSSLLNSSIKRLKNISKMGKDKFILRLLLYCFIIFFILYLYIKFI
ncbi:unnamed protein product [Gordionus sp. m RMFG-2023]